MARHPSSAAAIANTAAPTRDQGRRTGAVSGTASSSGIASRMSRRRCFGCFIRQRRKRGCALAGIRFQSGSPFSTAARMSDVVSLWNGRFPVSISNSTQLKAQMSARLSTAAPRACSGLMYAAVRRIIPARVADMICVGESLGSLVAAGSSAAFARPKSCTFTTPSGVILMFAGFRSRAPCFSCARSLI